MKKLLHISPVYDGRFAIITVYNVETSNGNIWFTGSYQECQEYINSIN